MDRLDNESVSHATSVHDHRHLMKSSPDDAVFDATQYEFFGKDFLEEELGGLDEEDSTNPGSYEEDLYREELKETIGGSQDDEGIDDIPFKEDPILKWDEEVDNRIWLRQQEYDAIDIQEHQKWSPLPYSSTLQILSRPQMISTCREQQQHHRQLQNFSSRPVLVPNPSTSYPLEITQHSRGHRLHNLEPVYASIKHQTSGVSSFPDLQLLRLPSGPHLSGNTRQRPPAAPVNTILLNHSANRPNIFRCDYTGSLNNASPQQLVHQNRIMPMQSIQHQMLQKRVFRPLQQLSENFSGMRYNPPLSQLPPRLGDETGRQMQETWQGRCFSQQGFGTRSQKGGCGTSWSVLGSKYMTAYEIQMIPKLQQAALGMIDRYVDDYYYQASIAKKCAGARLTHRFYPTYLKDDSVRSRPSSEPHPFLQVEGLGRVTFSSTRRPRALLEVDTSDTTVYSSPVRHNLEKPLEMEPVIAARSAIEDGFSVLLDVVDIDRFLQFNRLQDGGVQLKRRRQIMLEGLASSLQLVDPTNKTAPRNDLVFLRIISLPKGKKFLSRYLQLLYCGSELVRVICMAVFRHLTFLFGNTVMDVETSEITSGLITAVSSSVCGMDLSDLSACLSAVVCSPEQPLFRPIGSGVGDGASVVLKVVLERATELLINPQNANICSVHSRAFWEASFDEFFDLLTKYCFDKYESVVKCLSGGADATKTIRGEMPVELLRASLPHTSDRQRKLLLRFVERSMSVGGIGIH